MNYYQIKDFSTSCVSQIAGPILEKDKEDRVSKKNPQGKKNTSKSKVTEYTFTISTCKWRWEHGKCVPLSQPILTDICAPSLFFPDRKLVKGLHLSGRAKKMLLPWFKEPYECTQLTQLVHWDTLKPTQEDYFKLLAPYIDISEKVDFEKSIFIFYDGAKDPFYAVSKTRIPHFTQVDFVEWVEKHEERLQNKQWCGIFIEKLVLKEDIGFFSLSPYFWPFKSVLFNETIINQWKAAGITGLEVEKVNISVE